MNLSPDLERWRHEIEGYARQYGLDFYDVVFEMLDYDHLNEVAAYGGFPTRYPHWRFGMDYEELARSYSYGLSKIYELVNATIDARFPADSWNVYLFHFSDGENGDSRDTDACMDLLRRELLPKLNLFCFGQVRSSYGGGRFKNDIEEAFPGDPKVVTSEIRDKDEIYDAIKRFLGKGL